MSGIDATGVIKKSMMNSFMGVQPLTAHTRAKLIALGVDVSHIKSEVEGKIALQCAQLEKNSSTKNKAKSSNQEDQLLERAISLANDLDISVSDFDDVDDIVRKIKDKIEELKVAAGDNFDKKRDLAYYEDELSGIEQSQMTMIDITSSMNITANMNIFFHGLF